MTNLHPDVPPRIFVSYSRRRRFWVDHLRDTYRNAPLTLIADDKIRSGDDWWQAIFDMIRSADAVLFLVSLDSIESDVCRIECEFANRIGVPVIPVATERLHHDLPNYIVRSQVVGFHSGSDQSVAELTARLLGVAARSEEERIAAGSVPTPDRPFWHDDEISALFALGVEGREPEILEALRRRTQELGMSSQSTQMLDQLEREGVLASTRDGVEELRRRTGGPRSTRGAAKLDGAVSQAWEQRLLPVIGPGASTRYFRNRSQLARALASRHPYPLRHSDAHEPALVAQFLETVASEANLRSQWSQWLWEQAVPLEEATRRGRTTRVDWAALSSALVADEDELSRRLNDALAHLQLPLYVTTLPSLELEMALQRIGRRPKTRHCEWRSFVPNSNDIATEEPLADTDCSVDEPVVYHLQGSFDRPDLIVMTEDQHLDFLMACSQNDGEHNVCVPDVVSKASVRVNLMLIGFDLLHWETRIVLKAIANTVGDHRSRSTLRHLAIHDLLWGRTADDEYAREFVEAFLVRRPTQMETYWRSIEDATSDLYELSAEDRA